MCVCVCVVACESLHCGSFELLNQLRLLHSVCVYSVAMCSCNHGIHTKGPSFSQVTSCQAEGDTEFLLSLAFFANGDQLHHAAQ